MGEVANALNVILEGWHGRRYGALRALADAIEATGVPSVYHRLHRELKGRPSWEVVEWTVQCCQPVDAPDGWPSSQMERLAGLWTRENQDKHPPGYDGRIVHDGSTLREALKSSEDAQDLMTRVVLLQRERRDAHTELKHQEARTRELSDQIAQLRRQMVRLHDETAERAKAFASGTDTFFQQIAALQRQVTHHVDVADRLMSENREMRDITAATRREREDAIELAEARYHELERVRAEAETSRRSLNETIGELERRMASAHRELQEARRHQPHGNQPNGSDGRQTGGIGRAEAESGVHPKLQGWTSRTRHADGRHGGREPGTGSQAKERRRS